MVLPMPRRRWLPVLIPLCAAVLASCVDPVWEVRTYPLGEKVTIGHLTYVGVETQWYPEFGEGPGARVPRNQFLLVRLSVSNGGSAQAAVPNLSVEDSDGHRFPELTNGDGVPDWIGAVRTLAPADSLAGNAVFDVPAGHYRLHILDEEGQHEARIDLPFNFSTAPEEDPDQELPKTSPAPAKE